MKKKKKTGSVADIPKKPRHRVTTKRTDRLIVRKSKQNRRLTAVDISKQVIPDDKKKISPSTVKRRLSEAGLNGRVARKKSLLKPSHISQRLEWARTYESYTAEDWKRVVFSDESPFTLFSGVENAM